jgi:epoxyqueuosine reductase
LGAWLNREFHGQMSWIERTAEKRRDITKVFPDVRSVVSVAVNYYTDHTPQETAGKGRIARYAWGDDYHYFMDERLREFATWIDAEAEQDGLPCASRTYVDTGPILEKAWAQRAGIGWIGKHSNLVSTDYGSWLILGEVLISVELDSDTPAPDQCGACRLCIEICPTDAIPEPYVLDATKCIAYLTIEHRGPIPDMYHSDIGNRIFGCDDCLDICPYNEHAVPTSEGAFAPRTYALSPDLSELAEQTQVEFQTTFKKSPMKRTKYEGLQRNIEIARKNAS